MVAVDLHRQTEFNPMNHVMRNIVSAFVAVLQGDGHTHRVLLTVAAPARSNAALHRPQCLAIGLAGLHPRIHQLLAGGLNLKPNRFKIHVSIASAVSL